MLNGENGFWHSVWVAKCLVAQCLVAICHVSVCQVAATLQKSPKGKSGKEAEIMVAKCPKCQS